jgi:Nitroreductase family
MHTPPSPAERLAGPEPATPQEVAAYVVAAAVWSPSVHNTQPWLFSASGQEIRCMPTPAGSCWWLIPAAAR